HSHLLATTTGRFVFAKTKGRYMVLRTSRFRTHGKGQHIDGTPWHALERPLRRLRGPRRALPCTVEIPVGPSCHAVQRRIPLGRDWSATTSFPNDIISGISHFLFHSLS